MYFPEEPRQKSRSHESRKELIAPAVKRQVGPRGFHKDQFGIAGALGLRAQCDFLQLNADQGEDIMLPKSLKMRVGGALGACALGVIAIGVAWATPGVGISTTILSGPTLLDEVHVHSESEINDVKIKTRGLSDVYVVKNVIVPGGDTGWHSHPGPSIVSVVSGQATEYRSDDLEGVVHQAGTAFADEGGEHAHLVRNEGDTDLVLIAFQIVPLGATRRIDKPAP